MKVLIYIFDIGLESIYLILDFDKFFIVIFFKLILIFLLVYIIFRFDCIGFLKFFCFFEDFKYGIFNLVFIKL